MDQRLRKADYQQILQNKFSDPSIKFVKADLKPLSKNTEGFMGSHFKLQITYDQNGTESILKLFVKTKLLNVGKDHPSNKVNVFNKEIFFYNHLLKEFAKYGYDTSFAPKCYLCVGEDTMVLEDMAEEDYHLPGRQVLYDVSKVKYFLKALALYHGAGYAYEKTKTAELGRPFCLAKEYPDALKEIFYTQYIPEGGFGSEWFKASIKSFNKLINFLPNDDSYKKRFKELLNKAEFGKIFVEDYNLQKTCCHGDLWSNNMMFKYLSGLVVSCCLVDYQLVRYFYPAFDVILATHFNTDEEFIENHLEEMYQYYYDTLAETVKNYGHSINEIYSKEDFEKSIKICKPDALLQVASVNGMVFVPADLLTNFMKDKFLQTGEQTGEGDMEKKIEDMQDEFCPIAFENDEKYRKIMTKHLHDLYDALEEKYSTIN